jgi:hypothetical protein
MELEKKNPTEAFTHVLFAFSWESRGLTADLRLLISVDNLRADLQIVDVASIHRFDRVFFTPLGIPEFIPNHFNDVPLTANEPNACQFYRLCLVFVTQTLGVACIFV